MTAVCRTAPVALLIALLSGCDGSALRWEGTDTYTVRSGDTLYAIAFRYGIDYRQLAKWNNISESYLIHPGDTLRLSPPTGAARTRKSNAAARSGPSPKPAPDPAPRWTWPVEGRVVAGFADTNSKGLDIAGIQGQTVHAAAAGRVVYSGSGLIGYGQLIIIKHNNTYLSAYGHNEALLVAQGDTVKGGQRIAKMGKGPGERPVLHFEIRLNGEPVDPSRHLPTR